MEIDFKTAQENTIRLREKYDITPEELKENILPLFFMMYDKGIDRVEITRIDAKLMISIDGKKIG